MPRSSLSLVHDVNRGSHKSPPSCVPSLSLFAVAEGVTAWYENVCVNMPFIQENALQFGNKIE